MGKQHYTAAYSRSKDYLFENDENKYFSPASRSRIVEFILERARFLPERDSGSAFGVRRLICEGVFLAAYPLHDGTIETPGSQRKLLSEEWASWSKWWKYQPLDAIRDYYGVKIGLYFAWLGFYTTWLIPPSVVGVLCLLYGLTTDDILGSDVCEGGAMANTTMCPSCDTCTPWFLENTCSQKWIKHYFDNNTTVVFAVLMSLWSVVFLDFWKRYSAEIEHRWDVLGFDPEEEPPRPAYFLQLKNVKRRYWRENLSTQRTEPRPPFWKMKLPRVMLSLATVTLLVVLAGIAMLAIVIYKMSMLVALNALEDKFIKNNYSMVIAATGALINLIVILTFNFGYKFVAKWLTEKELHRTETEFQDSLILKNYLFEFITFYTSIFYVAFIKGQFIGTPDKYNRLFGLRYEECQPGGCFMELTIQLAIIFVGKQFITAIFEYYEPVLLKFVKQVRLAGLNAQVGEESDAKQIVPQYVKDFELVEWGREGLFKEYLEMVIQFGFITIFVCAFPLAPLFALLNNILELRLDAKKILELHRRPIAQKVVPTFSYFPNPALSLKVMIKYNTGAQHWSLVRHHGDLGEAFHHHQRLNHRPHKRVHPEDGLHALLQRGPVPQRLCRLLSGALQHERPGSRLQVKGAPQHHNWSLSISRLQTWSQRP